MDLPINGMSLAVDGSLSLRMSSNTEMDSSKVTLKPSFSDTDAFMKNEATSRTRKQNTGTIKLTTYRRGLLLMVICNVGI